ncbi:MAG: metallophosphoesterase [Gemmatimonadota bacterium]
MLDRLPQGPSFRVLVLGDWGTGDEGQRELARRMADVHADDPPDLVLTVGDNFYPDGVESVDDPKWARVFEEVYTEGFWDTVGIRPSLGNHDHRGSVDAQVEYSALDPRWDLPAPYYAFTRSVPGVGVLHFVALDTEPIDDEEPEARAQLAWLGGELGRPADWTVAFGHHPLASSGLHGPSDEMVEYALPYLQGNAHLYVAGHDHITEFAEVGGGLSNAVCGGGAGDDNATRVLAAPGSFLAFSGGGWCVLRFFADQMAVELYDAGGTLRFRRVLPREGDGAPTPDDEPASGAAAPTR